MFRNFQKISFAFVIFFVGSGCQLTSPTPADTPAQTQNAATEKSKAATHNNAEEGDIGLDEDLQTLDFYNQVLTTQRDAGDKAGEAATLSNISRVYWEQGDLQQSLDILKQALSLQQEIDDKWGENQTRFNMGVAYIATGDLTKAEEQLSIVYSADESERDPALNQHQPLLESIREQISQQEGN